MEIEVPRKSLVLAVALCIAAALAIDARAEPMKRPAKHIILFIGDGMQLAHEIAASRYLYGQDHGLSFQKLGYRANVTTWDVTTYNRYAARLGKDPYDPAKIVPSVGYDPLKGGFAPYPLQQRGIDDDYFLNPRYATDSASAATAWATGYKTEDGNIAWLPGDPPGGSLKTIAEILRDEGFSIGVVSTVPFSHATPAAHVSHNVSRDNYHQIAEEILRTTKPEVVIGGGHPVYDGGRYMPITLYRDVKSGAIPDYVFVERKTGRSGSRAILSGAQDAVSGRRRLFGLFGGSGGNFEPPIPIDRPGAPSVLRSTRENPLLSEATQAALLVLSQDPDGWFVVIEQGDIDWANHANDFSWMIGSIWDLHQAVQAAIDFVNLPGDRVRWDNTLLIVTADHANSYLRFNPSLRLGAGDLPRQVLGGFRFGRITTRPSYPDGEVTYGTMDHTNELARLYATGGGVELFARYEKALYSGALMLDNTHIFQVMAEAAGVPQPTPLRIVK